jgi:hypothetical protein
MLEKIQKINIPQRIWIFIVGTEKPNMLTQISVAFGLCIWFYFFSWHLLTFLSLTMMENLDKANELDSAFNRIGGKYQMLLPGNITTYLWIHSLIQLIVFSISLTGLILIWRKKKIGFLLYIFSNASTYIITFFVLGLAYMANELSFFDFVLLLGATLYFATGYWLFYKK